MPSLSIIIPCYNSGQYLPEAISSIESYDGRHSCEVIIVNDGSTDQETLQLLDKLSAKGYTVLHQDNAGPAAARNTGIRNCNAGYILFLDSDNKIRPAYIDEGIQALENDPAVGVAYGNVDFFGNTASRQNFNVREFNIQELVGENYIDICAVIRKAAWAQVAGLDEERSLMGHEDWEFWIHLYKYGWKFHHINKTLYDYRIRSQSLLAQTSGDHYLKKVRYIYAKHSDVVYQCYIKLLTTSIIYKEDTQRPLRSFFKNVNSKYFHIKLR